MLFIYFNLTDMTCAVLTMMAIYGIECLEIGQLMRINAVG